jgi:outer membrane protein insertion porin family
MLLALAALAASQTKTGKPPAKATSKTASKPVSGPAPAADKWPIASIAVEGNHVYTAAQVIGVSGLTVGQIAGKAEFDEAVTRLTNCGAFETAGYRFESKDGGSYNATLQITEIPAFYAVRFEDLRASDAELEKLLASKDPLFSATQTPASPVVFTRYAAWIEEYLKSRGITEKVAARVATAAPETYAVVFRPEKEPPSVAEVTFEGNHILSQLVLRDAVASATVGLVYREADFRKALQASVIPVYEARGRMHVTFPKLRAELVSDVKGVRVYVTVDEGEVYSFGKVDVAAPAPLDSARLLRAADLKPGDIANFDQVNEAIDRLRKAVRRDGYLDATVTTERREEEGKKIVDLTLRVTPGPLYTMGKLTITGLDLEGEPAVRRMWSLAQGQPFNPEYPDAFLKTVHDDRMFDHLGATKADTAIDHAAHTVNVTLTFGAAAKPEGLTKKLP